MLKRIILILKHLRKDIVLTEDLMLNCSRSLDLSGKFREIFALLLGFHEIAAIAELLSILQVNGVKAGLVDRFEFALTQQISPHVNL